jgi:hypothetical protein
LLPENAALAALEAELDTSTSQPARRDCPVGIGDKPGNRDRRFPDRRTEEVQRWACTFKQNCEEHLKDVDRLASWLALPAHCSSQPTNPAIPKAISEIRNGTQHPPVRCGQLATKLGTGSTVTLREVAKWRANARAADRRGIARELATDPTQSLRSKSNSNSSRIASALAAMDFTFLFDPGAGSVLHRVQRRRRPA